MTDAPPSYDASRPGRPTINFPVLTELHGKRVVLGNGLSYISDDSIREPSKEGASRSNGTTICIIRRL